MLLLLLACTVSPSESRRSGSLGETSSPTTTTQSGDSGDSRDSADSGDSGEVAATLQFLNPGPNTINPVIMKVRATGPVARVRYLAEDTYDLGESTDAASDFAVSYSFSTLGLRTLNAHGYDKQGREVATTSMQTVIENPTPENALGVWLWYIEGTGYTHSQLARKLSALGVKRIYIKVADDTDLWPEASDASVTAAYHAEGIEAWAWSYNYPGASSTQAKALTEAASSGYDGYVLDLEVEFDGQAATLESLLGAFSDARDAAIRTGTISGDWELRATTWGNPTDHAFRVDILDRYVDAHMPQTYVEVWGGSYLANLEDWIQAGTCEYRDLGATKPIHHIVSSEYDDITAGELNRFIYTSGAETSIWRVPGTETPLSIWSDWESVDWNTQQFAGEPSCR